MAAKVWFITGTSKGFGRVWAEAALKRGDKVAATARDPKTLDSLVKTYGERVLAPARGFATPYGEHLGPMPFAAWQKAFDPLLTPVTIDPSHPFPRVLNKALCLALLLRHKRKSTTGFRSGTALGVVVRRLLRRWP